MITATPSSAPAGASPTVTKGILTISQATKPSAEVLNDPLLPGDQLQIGLSGFPASSMVYVSLYGPGVPYGTPPSAMYPLLVDLPALRTDQNGEGIALWTVPSGTVTGSYAVWIDPLPTACTNNLCIPFTIRP
jgi:hypothetical protein